MNNILYKLIQNIRVLIQLYLENTSHLASPLLRRERVTFRNRVALVSASRRSRLPALSVTLATCFGHLHTHKNHAEATNSPRHSGVIAKLYRSFCTEQRQGHLKHRLSNPVKRAAWALGVSPAVIWRAVKKVDGDCACEYTTAIGL